MLWYGAALSVNAAAAPAAVLLQAAVRVLKTWRLPTSLCLRCCCPALVVLCCRLVDEEDLAYVITRAREVHDFWHVLFDCHTNVFGELALKALEFVQVWSARRIMMWHTHE